MNPQQKESYQRSKQLYNDVLLKMRETVLQQTPLPSYLLPNPWIEIPNPNKIAVIIDPRYDDLMEAVIMNFMHFMAPEGWIFLIGTAEQYKERAQQRFPQSLFMSIDNNLLYYDEKQIPNLTIENYNSIFCSPQLWEQIPCEHIAIFQKDCVMYRMFTEDWPIKYAYSGAFWYTGETTILNGVINGGFSLRKKTAMLNCIKHITWDMIEVYRKNTYTCHEYFPVLIRNEDMFFTYACEILHYPVAPIHLRKQLAIESEYFIGTSVFHGWNKAGYQIEEWANQILSLSPLFSKILPGLLEERSTLDKYKTGNETEVPDPVFELPDKSEPEIK